MLPIILSRALLAMLLAAGPSGAQTYFGYAGIRCGLDGAGEDFAADVAPFTNIAHVCPTGNEGLDAENLAHVHALGMTPLYHVEPVFFDRGTWSMRRRPDLALWQQTQRSVVASGVPPTDIIFFVADEPSLMRIWPQDLTPVIRRIQTDLPGARTMIIDVFRDRHPPQIPASVDYWGFNSYAITDPAQNDAFMRHLRTATQIAPRDVELVLVMDAIFSAVHAEAGLHPEDMADVARAYADLAHAMPEVSILMAYAWPSGIGGEATIGTRDLPDVVRAAHGVIGREITGRE